MLMVPIVHILSDPLDRGCPLRSDPSGDWHAHRTMPLLVEGFDLCLAARFPDTRATRASVTEINFVNERAGPAGCSPKEYYCFRERKNRCRSSSSDCPSAR